MRVNLHVERASAIHRLHPLTRLAMLATVFFTAYTMEEAAFLVPLALAEAALLAAAGAAANVRRLLPLFVGVPAASFVIWSFFYGRGEPLAVVGRVGITGEAVRYAAGMAIKLETFLAASILFLSVTSVEEFTAALRGLGVPYRMSFTIALSFRLVPLFLASAFAVVDAQQARGLDFSRGNPAARLRQYVPVLIPVFMGALRRADAMAIALESRGFGGPSERTLFVRARAGVGDAVAGAALAAVAGFYLSAWALGWGKIR